MQLLKVFKRITDHIFGVKRVEQVYPIYKTRAQLVSEGRVVPRRYMSIKKSN